MVIVIGVASGLLLGVLVAWIWGLRKSQGVRPVVLLVALAVLPTAYFWGAEAFGWPTPGSIAESYGLLGKPLDRALFGGASVVTTVLTVAVLVRSGVMRRLERWSASSE
ncbi:MAG: hypothetical protein JWQ45_2302 [Blastococcus sp.]|nr:hypothetical protein [Blastococcus sp.]